MELRLLRCRLRPRRRITVCVLSRANCSGRPTTLWQQRQGRTHQPSARRCRRGRGRSRPRCSPGRRPTWWSVAGRGRPPKPKGFEEGVEDALQKMLRETLPPEDRVKLLNVCVRWAAVKAKLVLPEHGEGFLTEED